MTKPLLLFACLWLCGTASALAAPEGVYRGPGHFPGYYGGYLYGYHPGPSLPQREDRPIVCERIFIADRFLWSGTGFVSSPMTDKVCRSDLKAPHGHGAGWR